MTLEEMQEAKTRAEVAIAANESLDAFHESSKSQRARSELAELLDMFLESEICSLYGVTPGTAEAWRKRRKGPAYILAGNNYLYPRAGVLEHLQSS